MKVLSQKSLEHSQIQFEIRVEGEEFQKGLDAAYRAIAPKLNVPGFRKGKAPKNLALQTYGVGILFEDTVQETYPAAYEQAITEAGIEPVNLPDVDIVEIDETGYTFTAVVTQKPAVKLGKYKGLAVGKEALVVAESEVDEEVESMRNRNARQVDVADRPVENGDIVVIDYEGKLDGVAFEGGSAPSQQLTIGSGTFIPGFEEQIIGHTPGESFDINVTFPEGYPMEELAGKETVFSITLHAIKFNELPALDDEFAKDVSDEYSTVEELRSSLRTALEEYKKNDIEQKFEDDLLAIVVEDMEVEIPPVMIDRQATTMVEDFDKRLQQQGMNIDMYMQMLQTDIEAFRQSFFTPAERNIKTALALEEIVKVEDIVVSEEEFMERVEEIVKQIGGEMDAKAVAEMVDRPGLVRDIAVSKALQIVKDTAIVTEVQPGTETAETETEEKKPAKKAAKKKAVEEGAEEPAEKPKRSRAKKADKEAEEAKDEESKEETAE